MDYRTLRSAPLGSLRSIEAASLDSVVLDEQEARVLGCLMEKEMTTPDYYPMTLNSLTAACNQKTSRDPVVEYDDALVQAALDRLQEKGLTRRITGRTRACRAFVMWPTMRCASIKKERR